MEPAVKPKYPASPAVQAGARRLSLRFFVFALATSMFCGMAWAQEAPDVIIKRAVAEVAAAIDADRDIASGNRQKIIALVETRVFPHMNLQSMTRTATGRHWPRATPEQQQALIREFSRLLTNTYAGAFANYQPDTVIEYRPLRMQTGDTDVVVRSLVKSKGGEPMQLDYYLERSDGTWKVVDINVLGARLIETYKNQFNGVIVADGIEGLIKVLSARNRAIEARNRA